MKILEVKAFSEKYNAFWISPEGVIIPVETLHINSVLEFPEKFGTTTEELRAYYKKAKEPFGVEGKARNKIMTDLMKRGWIRIRFVDRNYTFIIEFAGRFDRKKRDYIWEWAVRISGNKVGTLPALYKKGVYNPQSIDIELHSIDQDIWHHTEMWKVIKFDDEFFQEAVSVHHTSHSLIENYSPKR